MDVFILQNIQLKKGKEHTYTTGMNSDVSGPEFRCVFFHLRRCCFFHSTLFNSLLIFREKQSQSMHREVRTRAVGPNICYKQLRDNN